MEKQAKSGQWPAFVTLKLDSTQAFLLMGSINLSNQLNLQELEKLQDSLKDNPEEDYGNRIARLRDYINIGDTILGQIHEQHKWLGAKEGEKA